MSMDNNKNNIVDVIVYYAAFNSKDAVPLCIRKNNSGKEEYNCNIDIKNGRLSRIHQFRSVHYVGFNHFKFINEKRDNEIVLLSISSNSCYNKISSDFTNNSNNNIRNVLAVSIYDVPGLILHYIGIDCTVSIYDREKKCSGRDILQLSYYVKKNNNSGGNDKKDKKELDIAISYDVNMYSYSKIFKRIVDIITSIHKDKDNLKYISKYHTHLAMKNIKDKNMLEFCKDKSACVLWTRYLQHNHDNPGSDNNINSIKWLDYSEWIER